MIVEPVYKGHRIQVEAVQVDDRWDATVNIHRVFSDEKPHVEHIWARRWVDLNGRDGGHV